MVKPLISRRVESFGGTTDVPGDKSVSHRALIIGASAVGETRIQGLLEGEDILHTADALRRLGAVVERGRDGVWRIQGLGVGGLGEAAAVLDMGNSGTAARLLIGLLATHPFTSFFTGDESLCRRPMRRVIEPLARMGAHFVARRGDRLPLAVTGAGDPVPITYELPVASAQVKSAILLAALNTPGHTCVVEPRPTRDHSELMLRHFGVEVRTERLPNGASAVTIVGEPEIAGTDVAVPGDPSSAAFPLAAALLAGGARLAVRGVGINPSRTGFLDCLREMGARLAIENRRREAGEPVADLAVEAGPLQGIAVPAERAPRMIDEYPILAVVAACAEGRTRMEGLAELRVKESDRLEAIAIGLAAAGVKVEVDGDTLTVHGKGRAPHGGCTVAAAMDHRIAMAFLVLGMATDEPVRIDDASFIDTSFPGFVGLMNGLGARMAPAPP